MRILIATDAWRPQINGVVQTYIRLSEQLERLGHEVSFLTPDGFRTVPMPTYPEIRLALITRHAAGKRIEPLAPDHIHIATEGPIGLATRAYCLKVGRPFTSSYHTRFPEYLNTRFPFIPVSFGYRLERWFHSTSSAVLVATNSLLHELEGKGLKQLRLWSRGVDTDFFRPRDVRRFGVEPVFLYVGRVAVEKNIAAFLDLDLPGQKVVVGGGPQLAALKVAYPQVTFTGALAGDALAEAFSSADVFVFPSRTDTYGIVLLEAMASGLPVAAYPVTGPKDVVPNGQTGVLDEDLRAAALKALTLDRTACREYALRFTWETCARQFLGYVPRYDTPPIEKVRCRL
jgi:glycosyltransferase involved in cell wall biosynthesis